MPAFKSELYYGEKVIDELKGYKLMQVPDGYSTGLRLAMRTTPYGEIVGAPAFPNELLIPQDEWPDRIKEMEERKSRLSDIINAAGLPCKDQSTTSLCWANAPVHCVEIQRVVQNNSMVILSPASVASPITKFKNIGGWAEQAIEYLVENGATPVDLWPANAINKQYQTEEARIAALDYKISEWWELVPRNMNQLVSCLLRRIPVACGYNWQGHETVAIDAVWVNGEIGVRSRNSWSMNWPKPGAGGWYILQGTKMRADDAICPRVVTAS